MTEPVRLKAEELKQTILKSEEYHKYDMYRRLLNETPDLKKKVNEFREANMLLQLGGGVPDRDKMQQLGMQYSDILTNSVVKEFLNAELILCKMLQQLNIILVSELELELDFL